MLTNAAFRGIFRSSAIAAVLLVGAGAGAQTPPVPSGSHPRMFMSTTELSAYMANAQKSKSEAAAQVAQCQDTLDNPSTYMDRGGSDGYNWPGSAVACAFAWKATGQQKYLTQALLYWQAALNDDMTLATSSAASTASTPIGSRGR